MGLVVFRALLMKIALSVIRRVTIARDDVATVYFFMYANNKRGAVILKKL